MCSGLTFGASLVFRGRAETAVKSIITASSTEWRESSSDTILTSSRPRPSIGARADTDESERRWRCRFAAGFPSSSSQTPRLMVRFVGVCESLSSERDPMGVRGMSSSNVGSDEASDPRVESTMASDVPSCSS